MLSRLRALRLTRRRIADAVVVAVGGGEAPGATAGFAGVENAYLVIGFDLGQCGVDAVVHGGSLLLHDVSFLLASAVP